MRLRIININVQEADDIYFFRKYDFLKIISISFNKRLSRIRTRDHVHAKFFRLKEFHKTFKSRYKS